MKPDYIYIWGIGWWDRAHATSHNVKAFFGGCVTYVVLFVFLLILASWAVDVVESIFPWLPWL